MMEWSMDFAEVYRNATNPDLIRLAQYCETLAGPNAMPRRHDFRPQDVSWILGFLYVVEVIDGGADYRFRLGGVWLKEVYGAELECLRVSEFKEGDFKKTLRANYDAVIQSRKPIYARGLLLWSGGHSIKVERLMVPFVDDDGLPRMILGAVMSDVPPELLGLYRGKGLADFIPEPLAN
jgi:hypothetical protein